jgi:hypothetical protein
MPITLLLAFAAVVVHFGGTSGSSARTTATISAEPKGAAATASRTAAEPLPTVVSEAQANAALEAGDLAVLALLERYPTDARAQLVRARAAKKSGDHETALGAVQAALELSAELGTDPHVAAILWWAVQKAETRQASLELLQGPMKSRGADVLYDLAVTDGIAKPLAKQARAWLGTRRFERDSSPQAAIAAALLLAPTCEVRKALTKRAENVGDERSAVLLRKFEAGGGCSTTESKPCNACLDEESTQAALRAITARKNEAPKTP